MTPTRASASRPSTPSAPWVARRPPRLRPRRACSTPTKRSGRPPSERWRRIVDDPTATLERMARPRRPGRGSESSGPRRAGRTSRGRWARRARGRRSWRACWATPTRRPASPASTRWPGPADRSRWNPSARSWRDPSIEVRAAPSGPWRRRPTRVRSIQTWWRPWTTMRRPSAPRPPRRSRSASETAPRSVSSTVLSGGSDRAQAARPGRPAGPRTGGAAARHRLDARPARACVPRSERRVWR